MASHFNWIRDKNDPIIETCNKKIEYQDKLLSLATSQQWELNYFLDLI